MFLLRRPSAAAIQAFVAREAELPFTYEAVGATDNSPPAGFDVDHRRASLGSGKAVFEAARKALRSWKQFDLGWVDALPEDVPIAEGNVVAVLAKTLGIWSLNTARIIYVIDEPRRFGFAYGTLPGHVEAGEERFLVEQEDDGDVWYDILAFSRPRHRLARLGYPWVRRLQRRFGRDSLAAMRRAVAEASPDVRKQ